MIEFVLTPNSSAIQEYAIIPAEDTHPAEIIVVYKDGKTAYNYTMTDEQVAEWLAPDASFGRLIAKIKRNK